MRKHAADNAAVGNNDCINPFGNDRFQCLKCAHRDLRTAFAVWTDVILIVSGNPFDICRIILQFGIIPHFKISEVRFPHSVKHTVRSVPVDSAKLCSARSIPLV